MSDELGRPLRILIAEDEPDIAEMLEMAFEMSDIEITGVAGNGDEALEMTEQTQPDIVLLDMYMPGSTGLDVLPQLHGAAPGVKVVVHSAIGATFMTDQALRAGAHAYIEKGVSPRTIITHLNKVMAAGAVRPVQPYPLRNDYT